MSEVLCANPLIRGTEFIKNDQGIRLFGACGPRGLASSASSALGNEVTCLAVYDLMRQHGWCDLSGASTIGELQWAAEALGCKIAAVRGYAEPWTDWQAWLMAQSAAQRPCTLELANGQALVDAISGKGENAGNLRYHFIAVLGRFTGGYSAYAKRDLPAGWWCADGDNFAGNNDNAHGFEAANVLQFYPDSVLGAARPCAGLALVGRQTAMAWTKQSDGTGRDDQAHTCGAGFMATLESRSETAVDGLMSETYLPDKTSFLPLSNGDVYTWNGSQVSVGQGAQVVVKLFDLLQAAEQANSGSGSGQIPAAYVAAKAAIDALSAAQKAGA